MGTDTRRMRAAATMVATLGAMGVHMVAFVKVMRDDAEQVRRSWKKLV